MDQNRKTRLIARLKTEIDSLSPKLKVIAKYVIDHPADFGMDPIRVTADKIGVSYPLVTSDLRLMGIKLTDARLVQRGRG